MYILNVFNAFLCADILFNVRASPVVISLKSFKSNIALYTLKDKFLSFDRFLITFTLNILLCVV